MFYADFLWTKLFNILYLLTTTLNLTITQTFLHLKLISWGQKTCSPPSTMTGVIIFVGTFSRTEHRHTHFKSRDGWQFLNISGYEICQARLSHGPAVLRCVSCQMLCVLSLWSEQIPSGLCWVPESSFCFWSHMYICLHSPTALFSVSFLHPQTPALIMLSVRPRYKGRWAE